MTKKAAVRGYGGEVLLAEGDLVEYFQQVREARGQTVVHPFDDLDVIAGHASLVAAAIKAKSPKTRVIGVEPQGALTLTNSLKAGEPLSLKEVNTIADGLAAPFAGVHTLRHVQTFVDEIVAVTDQEILTAMRLVWERCKVLAEPAASAPVAALIFDKIQLLEGSNVCCLISGGNVDLDNLKNLV